MAVGPEVRQPVEPPSTEFPKFPTLFTEADRARLTELNVQRKALTEAFGQTFSAEAWQAVAPVERGVRRLSLPFMSNIADFFSAEGTQPAFEFGLTPEQFAEKSRQFEIEFNFYKGEKGRWEEWKRWFESEGYGYTARWSKHRHWLYVSAEK
ncbi:hypothetical protein LCGC14_2470440, partial [marine sediment metagenome]